MSETTRALPLRAVWRSSSLRLTLLLTLVLWGAAVLVANDVYERSEDALVDRATAEIEELNELIGERLDADHPPLLPDEALREVPGAEPLHVDDEGSFARFLAAYTEEINEALGGFRREDDEASVEFMTARLWLLGESTGFAPTVVGPELIVEIMAEEIPERFHDSVETLAEPRLEAWPPDRRWLRRPPRERLALIVEAEELFEPRYCVGFLGADDAVEDANFEYVSEGDLARDEYRVIRVLAGDWDEPDARTVDARCLVAEGPVGDGTLVLGVRFDESSAVLAELRAARNDGLALVLGVALGAAALLAWLILGRLRRIDETFAAVSAGDLGARIPVGSIHDDFSRLAHNVNAALDRLEQLMSGVRAVSDNIAHDLRTPLTRLRNRIELLAQQGGGDATLVEQVTEEADRLLGIFNGLLRIAQLEQGSYRRALVDFDLAAMVRDAIDLYEPSITEKGIRLNVEVPSSGMSFLGDRDLWLQALTNLLDNAMKYTPADGMIEVALSQSPSAFSLTISDSGPGIPPEQRERVLQRFYRLEAHRGTEGSGLGLSLVAAVCAVHGARLELGGSHGLTVSIRWTAP